jgi:hypothetical protein
MKHLYLLLLAVGLLNEASLQAQCTNHTLDWDYREYFARTTGTIRTYVSLSQSQNQYFAFGANKLTITHNYTANTAVNGDVTTHTADAGSYGNGADVHFIGNGEVGFTFQTAVTNLQFSLYDIDRSQRVEFEAWDGATQRNISLATVSGSVLTISNNNSPNARVDASSTTVSNSSTDGTINVSIAGPITSVTITVSNSQTCSSSCGGGGNEDGSYFISDITACSNGSFPNNYHSVSQPFTGMPGYMLTVVDNKFYYFDPVSGVAKFIFQDNTHSNMNSLAYDAVNRLIYYTYSLSGSPGVNANEKALRRYDLNMDTFGVVLNNVNDLGIPTFGQGVESGAAAFYDGNLYWGIEGHSNTAVESIIYRVELNASQFPIGFSQVYAQDVRLPPSTSRQHDWADFTLNDGILYDFDGGVANSPTAQNANFFHQNLLTGAVTAYTPQVGVVPKQASINWQGDMFNIGAPAAGDPGQATLYNGTDGEGSPVIITHYGVPLVGSWGDAAEAFRPLCDFGDAPASYDPDAWSPAVNERDSALRIGSNIDIEWLTRGQSAAADLDNFDDGVATVTIFSNLYSTYQVQVDVYNNTSGDATLMGWLDWNGNGVFDVGEASAAQTISPLAGTQQVYLSWTGISSTLNTGDITYLRIRITSAANSMDADDATGWFGDGETEDYPVSVQNIVLPVNLLSFDAKAINNQSVQLNWKAISDEAFDGYAIERSRDGNSWSQIGYVSATGSHSIQSYVYVDQNPYKGISHYRLRLREKNAAERISDIRQVKIADARVKFSITPNPATTQVSMLLTATRPGTRASIRVINSNGSTLYTQTVTLREGSSTISLPLATEWPAGTYLVVVATDEGIESEKLLINR